MISIRSITEIPVNFDEKIINKLDSRSPIFSTDF